MLTLVGIEMDGQSAPFSKKLAADFGGALKLKAGQVSIIIRAVMCEY
jgi:hypothetical protein